MLFYLYIIQIQQLQKIYNITYYIILLYSINYIHKMIKRLSSTLRHRNIRIYTWNYSVILITTRCYDYELDTIQLFNINFDYLSIHDKCLQILIVVETLFKHIKYLFSTTTIFPGPRLCYSYFLQNYHIYTSCR